MAKPLLDHQNADSNSSLAPAAESRTIGILGSGDFARSLSMRLVCSGFKVVVGSRNPKRNASLFPSAVEVTVQADAIKKADIVFVAIFREHYTTLYDLNSELSGKILVDVSNNAEINHHKESNAEYLASLFPACTVVKGFNVISSWTLQSGPRDGNKQVFICCDNQEAKQAVAEIAHALGFTPVDMGALFSAREIENIPLRLLPAWKIPVFLALGLFLCFYTYNFIRQVLHPYIREKKNKFYKIPVEIVNTTLPCVAYVMLSLVYLPGVLAAIFQLYHCTKYRRFPDWLDQWLQHRKQIGLLSFFCAALHAVYSLCLPMRRSHRYLLLNEAVKQVEKKTDAWVEEEVWRMEIYISFGIMALGLLSLLAITSLPSISNSLNWREFSFVQGDPSEIFAMAEALLKYYNITQGLQSYCPTTVLQQKGQILVLQFNTGQNVFTLAISGCVDVNAQNPTASMTIDKNSGSRSPYTRKWPRLGNTALIHSTLGFVALVISTLHTLTYGWTRAFDENQYKFYLPPTFTLTLLVPCTIILAKLFFHLLV